MNLLRVTRSGAPQTIRLALETYRADAGQLAALSAMFRCDGAGRFENRSFSSRELAVDQSNKKMSIDSVLGGERNVSSYEVNQPTAGEPWAIEGNSDFYGFALRGVSAQRPRQPLGALSYSLPAIGFQPGCRMRPT